MNQITFNTGVKKIAVNDMDGELITVLMINTADAATSKRFVELAGNLEEIANAGEDKAKIYAEKYKEYAEEKFEELPDEVKTSIITDSANLRIEVLEQMIREIDALFGKDTIRNVFKAGYEIHEDFVPDEDALIDFVNSVMPVMNELFETRTNEIRKRYSPNRRQRRAKKG